VKTISVVSRKGGSGKTTLAVQIAIGLWLRGKAVLLADMDPQWSSLEVLKHRAGEGPSAIASSGSKLYTLQTAARRSGVQVLVIDTPAANEAETAYAVTAADLALMVVRPTFLDIAAAAHTSQVIRQLRKPGLMVLNQAQAPRGAVEPPTVKRALEALELLRLPLAPVILRARAAFQTTLDSGRSPEEVDSQAPAGRETAQLCDYVHAEMFGVREAVVRG
jgi:chromosome partitioning protein